MESTSKKLSKFTDLFDFSVFNTSKGIDPKNQNIFQTSSSKRSEASPKSSRTHSRQGSRSKITIRSQSVSNNKDKQTNSCQTSATSKTLENAALALGQAKFQQIRDQNQRKQQTTTTNHDHDFKFLNKDTDQHLKATADSIRSKVDLFINYDKSFTVKSDHSSNNLQTEPENTTTSRFSDESFSSEPLKREDLYDSKVAYQVQPAAKEPDPDQVKSESDKEKEAKDIKSSERPDRPSSLNVTDDDFLGNLNRGMNTLFGKRFTT